MPISATEVLDQVPVPLGVTVGPDHVVELLNAAARRLIGADGLIGRPAREILHEAGHPEQAGVLDEVYRTGRPQTGRVAAGSPAGVDVDCTPLRDRGGRVTGVLLQASEPRGATRARGLALQHLAETLSRTATPAGIGRLVVTTAAELLGADAASMLVTGADPAVMELAHASGWPEEMQEQYRVVPVQAGRPMSDAVLRRTPVWIEDAGQWRERYPDMAPVHAAGGYQATACVPLVVGDRDLGAVVFSFARPRVFSPDERDYLTAVAALCAQALDRARLYTDEQSARAVAEEQRDRMTFLAEANLLLEAPLSVEERLRKLAELAVHGVADWCSVHLVRGKHVQQVAVAHADPAKVDFVERLQERYPPDPDAPGGAIQVARSGQPVLLPEIADEVLVAAARDETHLALIRAIGMRSAVVVPLLVRGTSLGALTLVQAESGRRFDEADLVFVRQLARGAALSLDNARLYEEQHRIAHTLQAALLPAELPEIPGLRLAARYVAQGGERDVTVGGDLYDVTEGPEPGVWSVLIADVCGKGPDAAAMTAQIRHTVRAEVGHGLGPAEVLHRLNAALVRQAGPGVARFATVVHARVRADPAGATVTLANAGHLPPLVMRPDGVGPVGAGGTLLGVYPDVELAEVEVRIGHGESLVLYTDGLTEARGADGWFGPQRLVGRLERSRAMPADEIADGLLADVMAFQAGALRDDLAVLVLQACRFGEPAPATGVTS